jgi:hypothetical protein
LPLPLVKIVCSLLLPQPLPHFAMQLVNRHSYTAAKEISESVLLLLNAYQVCVTLFQLEHR